MPWTFTFQVCMMEICKSFYCHSKANYSTKIILKRHEETVHEWKRVNYYIKLILRRANWIYLWREKSTRIWICTLDPFMIRRNHSQVCNVFERTFQKKVIWKQIFLRSFITKKAIPLYHLCSYFFPKRPFENSHEENKPFKCDTYFFQKIRYNVHIESIHDHD